MLTKYIAWCLFVVIIVTTVINLTGWRATLMKS